MKICKKCDKSKYSDQFWKNKASKDGLQSVCSDCQRLANKLWYKKKREENPEFIRKRDRAYYRENREQQQEKRRNDYAKHRDKRLEYGRQWRKDNSEYKSKKDKEWQENNKQRKQETDRIYREKNRDSVKLNKKNYHIKNADRINKKSREWRSNNRDQVRIQSHIRRARKFGVNKNDFSYKDWETLLAQHNYRCFYCDINNVSLEQDHKTPLSRGGDNTRTNIVPACFSCNRTKGTMTAKEFIEWRRRTSPNIRHSEDDKYLNDLVSLIDDDNQEDIQLGDDV